MMKTISKKTAAGGILLAGSLALAACGGGGGGGSSSGSATSWQTDAAGNVELKFVAHAGNTPITCDSSLTLGNPARAVRMEDMRFYVSDVQLLKADGSKVALRLGQNDDYNFTSADGRMAVSLIDLEQSGSGKCEGGSAAINATIAGTVPAGTYTGVEMTLGVPFGLNHLDSADAATPRVLQNSVQTAMSWNWRGGRKFTRIQFVQDDKADATPWPSASPGEAGQLAFHLGSTGCVGNPAEGTPISTCKAPNRVPVVLEGFNPATRQIAFDVAALFAHDVAGAADGGGHCHSGATAAGCARPFAALALDWKADGSGNGMPLAGQKQSVFKAVAR